MLAACLMIAGNPLLYAVGIGAIYAFAPVFGFGMVRLHAHSLTADCFGGAAGELMGMFSPPMPFAQALAPVAGACVRSGGTYSWSFALLSHGGGSSSGDPGSAQRHRNAAGRNHEGFQQGKRNRASL